MILLGLAAILMPALSQAPATQTYTIQTIAGDGTGAFAGDGAAAASAQVYDPVGLTFDNAGNLYIADQLNSRIRKIAADGTITTVAGSDLTGFTGDGAAATSAQLNHPCGVVLDKDGNMYIADTANHVIRKVTAGGTISTFAGTGLGGYAGDYDPALAADEDTTNDENNGKATLAALNKPIGLAMDAAGNLLIADTLNSRIRKVDTNGIITTIAGNGSIGSLGDGGAATSAALYNPQGIALDTAGNLYIADTSNDLIRKVSADGIITSVAGNRTWGYSGDGGPATSASLNYPKSVAVAPDGSLFIVDSYNSRIRVVTPDGIIRTIAGDGWFGFRGDGGPALSARLRFPSALILDAAGNVIFSDTQNNRIRRLMPNIPVSAVPTISPGGVVSASEFGAFSSVAPGAWIEIYGSKLASDTRSWTAADFTGSQAPTSLSGTSVKIGGLDAFIAYISPTQVNALVPFSLPAGSQELTVTTATGTSSPYTITVNATQAGLYAPQAFKVGDRQYAAAVSPDGSAFVFPSSAPIAGMTTRRARPGETIVLFGIGFGKVAPSLEAGQVVQQANSLESPVDISVGGAHAVVSYQGLAPGTIGLYQFNVVVPNVAAGDAVPVTFTQGGSAGSQTLYTAVQN